MSAEHGAPYSVTLYRTDASSPDALLDWYVRTLTERGWSADRTRGGGAAVFRKGIRTLAVKVDLDS